MTRERAVLILTLADVGAFVALGVIGLITHEDSISATPIVRSIVPFAAAWLLISPFFGAYSDEALRGRKPLAEIALVWLPVGVVALVARAAIFDRHLFNAFFVIALIGHGLFLIGWRAIYSRWLARSLIVG
jgi:hypothetical protein